MFPHVINPHPRHGGSGDPARPARTGPGRSAATTTMNIKYRANPTDQAVKGQASNAAFFIRSDPHIVYSFRILNHSHSKGTLFLLMRRVSCSASAMSPKRLEKVKLSIVRTIQAGAPLYNKGDVAGCERLYRDTYKELLEMSELASEAPEVDDILRRQLRMLKEGAVDSNAWQLRYGFDDILSLDPAPLKKEPSTSAYVNPTACFPLIQCDSAQASGCFASMDDGVMGGVSQGMVTYKEDNACAVFSGVVSTANNGGFSSIRCRESFPGSLKDYEGFYVDCMAQDATKVFQFVAKDMEAVQTFVSFKAPFTAPGGSFGRVYIPFSAFDSPEQMGRRVARAPLDLSSMAELGFMVLKPSIGEFTLLFKEIGVYK